MPLITLIRNTSIIRKKWPVIFVLTLLLACVSYAFYAYHYETDAGTVPGMAYGITGAGMLVFLMLYKIRKHTYRYKVGSTQEWLKAHMYISVLCIIIISMHTGFKIEGAFSGILFASFILVAANGVFGAMLYNTIPLAISKYGKNIVLKEDIEGNLSNFLAEADISVADSSDEFKAIYKKQLRPIFEITKTRWEYLLTEERALINSTKNLYETLKKDIPAGEVYDLNILVSLLVEKEKMAFMWAKLRIMRVWLNWHLPLTTAMVTALVIHVATIIYY